MFLISLCTIILLLIFQNQVLFGLYLLHKLLHKITNSSHTVFQKFFSRILLHHHKAIDYQLKLQTHRHFLFYYQSFISESALHHLNEELPS